MRELIRLADGESVSPVVAFGLPVLAVVLSPLTSWVTVRFVRRRELAERRRSDMIERVRLETLRWAGPILNTVDDMRHRLGNILNMAGYLALDPEWKSSEDWSMTHEYFLDSTMYLFAAYFGYMHLLQSSLSLEVFRSQQDKDELFGALRNVSSTLSVYPAPWPRVGMDCQVFTLQQAAIGEATAIIGTGTDSPRCLTYSEFTVRLADPAYAVHIKPLRALLLNLAPSTDGRWARLQHVRDALDELAEVCRRLLAVEPIGAGPKRD